MFGACNVLANFYWLLFHRIRIIRVLLQSLTVQMATSIENHIPLHLVPAKLLTQLCAIVCVPGMQQQRLHTELEMVPGCSPVQK